MFDTTTVKNVQCRFGGAEGTDERVLALNTDDCRVQETRC